MHFNICFLFKIFLSFLEINLYISGILLPKILFIFIFKNLEINFIDSFKSKSDISLLLQSSINTSVRAPIIGDLYSHLLLT